MESSEPSDHGPVDDSRWEGSQRGSEVFFFQRAIPQERLPMLEVVFERFIHGLASHLRNLTSDNIEIRLQKVSSLRFSEYLGAIPSKSLIGVFYASAWENSGLVTVDSSLIYAIVDVFLGGRNPALPQDLAGRSYTTIEKNLVEHLFNITLHELGLAFEPISPVKFNMTRVEINPKFTGIVRPASPCILIDLKTEVEGSGGSLQFLFPYATLEPVHHLLTELFLGEKFGRDLAWEEHIASEVLSTDITLEAILDEQPFELGDVLSWKEGDAIRLSVGNECLVTVRCAGQKIFSGKMGHRRGLLALSIEDDFLDKNQEY